MTLELSIKARDEPLERDLEPILSILELITIADLGKVFIVDREGNEENTFDYQRIWEIYRRDREIRMSYK